ncbi:hypothetical protein DRJ17_00365 [Candidatus Woesearchaeota archaeon]|nr:MAG: hypothetical protein DRJ17_00365 [Candidatus Woesearchaeota archaeon]
MLKGNQTKIKISISLDKNLYKEIREYCDKNMIKISTYIEYLLKKSWNKSLTKRKINKKCH